jgi:hypothetical protein
VLGNTRRKVAVCFKTWKPKINTSLLHRCERTLGDGIRKGPQGGAVEYLNNCRVSRMICSKHFCRPSASNSCMVMVSYRDLIKFMCVGAGETWGFYARFSFSHTFIYAEIYDTF